MNEMRTNKENAKRPSWLRQTPHVQTVVTGIPEAKMLNLFSDWRKILAGYIFLAWNFRLYVMFGHSSPQGRESYGHVLGMYFYYSLCDLPTLEPFSLNWKNLSGWIHSKLLCKHLCLSLAFLQMKTICMFEIHF